MPRSANPKVAAQKLAEAISALIRAELAYSPALKKAAPRPRARS